METASYWTRTQRRAVVETKIAWNAYRYWFFAAPPLWGAVMQTLRRQRSGHMNWGALAIDTASGAAFTAVGCYVISLVRSFKLLDDDRQAEVTAKEKEIQASREVIRRLTEATANPKKLSAHEEEHLQMAIAELGKFPMEERLFLRYVLHVGKVYTRDVAQQLILSPGVLAAALERGRHSPLLHIGVERPGRGEYFEINPTFRPALEQLLNPPNPS